MTRLSGLLLLTSIISCGATAEQRVTMRPWSTPIGSPEANRGAGGIALSLQEPQTAMFLWLYEWNMFGAVAPGQHTHGTLLPRRQVSRDGTSALVDSEDMSVSFRATAVGADVILRIANHSQHDWPDIAAVIPCFNPGPAVERSDLFSDEERVRTFFLSSSGLSLLADRSIHFSATLRQRIEKEAESGNFAFSSKWPTSPIDASAGILIRESSDGKWVTGIAWEDFIAVQGHNPWKCMHVSVRVGPLRRGETKSLRGKVYLMPGDKEAFLQRFRRDFR